MITEKIFDAFWAKNGPNYKNLCQVIDTVRTQIEPDQFDDDEAPNIQLTISVNDNCTEWTYQSGDTSYVGSCYHHTNWGIGWVDLDTPTCIDADYLISELAEAVFADPENQSEVA